MPAWPQAAGGPIETTDYRQYLTGGLNFALKGEVSSVDDQKVHVSQSEGVCNCDVNDSHLLAATFVAVLDAWCRHFCGYPTLIGEKVAKSGGTVR